MPIVPDEPLALRHQIEEQARQSDWLAAANSEKIPAALATELPSREVAARGAVAEPATPEPDEGASSQPAIEAEPLDPQVATDPDAVPQPPEEHREDRS
jgi:hypothetical protein